MIDQFEKASRGVTVDLPLRIDRAAEASVAEQLEVQLHQAVMSGQLPPGSRLPSTRTLARVLQVSRGTVLTAYDNLLAAGYLVGRTGAGTFVSEELPAVQAVPVQPAEPSSQPRWLRGVEAMAQVGKEVAQAPGLINFQVGQPAVAPLSDAAWKRAWRRVAAETLPGGYISAAGDPELRTEIAAYLRRSRGLNCHAQDVLVTSGAIQGLHLIARAVLTPGDTAAFEDPGYRLARQVLQERGAQVLPVPVDEDGLQVAQLPTGEQAPPLVYTTPSHQFPLGSRLSLPRRHALLAWAREQGSLIVEDDYNGEFRYDVAPLPALASLDPQQVAYLGTFSKVLSPALRVGYIVAPPALHTRLFELKTIADYHTSWPVQRALTFFLRSGDLDRHLGRMRRVYAHKRRVLVEALSTVQPWAKVGGLEAGFHIHLLLKPEIAADEVVRRAATQGVLVSELTTFYVESPQVNGLLLGYGGLEPEQLHRGASILNEVIRQVATEQTS